MRFCFGAFVIGMKYEEEKEEREGSICICIWGICLLYLGGSFKLTGSG